MINSCTNDSNDSHLTITDIANEIEFLTSNKLTKNNNSESIRYKEVKITRTINQVSTYIFCERIDEISKKELDFKLESTKKEKEISNEKTECRILTHEEYLNKNKDYLNDIENRKLFPNSSSSEEDLFISKRKTFNNNINDSSSDLEHKPVQQIQQNKKIVRKKILHKNASPSFDFNKVKINLSTIDKSKTNQLKECSVILEKIDLSKFLYKNSCNLCKIKNNSVKRCNKNK